MNTLPYHLIESIVNHCTLNGWYGLVRCVCKTWRDTCHCTTVCVDDIYVSKSLVRWHKTKHWGSIMMQRIASAGRCDVLKWAREFGCPWDQCTCASAAARGDLVMLQWARDHGCPWDAETCTMAVRYNHMDVFLWAYHTGCPINNGTVVQLAKHGHCNILNRFFSSVHRPWLYIDYKAYKEATRHGHLDVLKEFARVNTQTFEWIIFGFAAAYDHLHILTWAWNERGYRQIYNDACYKAAKNGHVRSLQWLRDHEYEWDDNVCASAAWGGHLHVLKWLRDNGCPWSASTCSGAASGGHLHILKWARDNGCMWDEGTTHEAAQEGHLHVLKWACAHGCPWGEGDDVDVESIEVAQWLHVNNYVFNLYTDFDEIIYQNNIPAMEWLYDTNQEAIAGVASAAATQGNLTIMKWLHDRNFIDFDTSPFHAAVISGNLSLIQWLRRHGCPWDELTCFAAASHGHLHILQWLRANGCPCTRHKMLWYACVSSNLDVFVWVFNEGYPMNDQILKHLSTLWYGRDKLEWLLERGHIDCATYQKYLPSRHQR